MAINKKYFTVCILLLIGVIFALILFWNMKIKTIFVISNDTRIQGLEEFENKNVLLFDKAENKKKLMQKNPFIEDVTFEKQYPDSIVLHIKGRTPIARIAQTDSVYIDAFGILFPDVKSTVEMPVIDTDEPTLTSGLQSDWRLVSAVNYLKSFNEIGLVTKSILIENKNAVFHIYLDNNEEIFIPFSSQLSSIATSLQIITSRFRIEGKLIHKIDFRFDKPIVVIANEQKN